MNKHTYQSNYVLFSHLAYIWVFIFPALAQLSILKTMKCEKKIEFQLVDCYDSIQMSHWWAALIYLLFLF